MNELQQDDLNLKIRKMLKEFGVQAHKLVRGRFETNTSDCKVVLKLEIDSNKKQEIENIIKIKE